MTSDARRRRRRAPRPGRAGRRGRASTARSGGEQGGGCGEGGAERGELPTNDRQVLLLSSEGACLLLQCVGQSTTMTHSRRK